MDKNKALEFKKRQMDQNMKGTEDKIYKTDKESELEKMEILIKESLWMVFGKVMEFINDQMDQNIKGTERGINEKEKGFKLRVMEIGVY